jgi:hypothetical protein
MTGGACRCLVLPLETVVEGGWPLDRSSYDTAETRAGCLQCGDLGLCTSIES